jgi:hypothetical protein
MTAAQIERRATVSAAAAAAVLWIVVGLVVAAGLTPRPARGLPVDNYSLPPIEVPTKHRGVIDHD